MNHIFYQTKTHFSNTGDALINHALIEILRKYGTIHANCASDIPMSFLEALGIMPEERVITDGELSFIKTVIIYAIRSRNTGEKVFVFSGLGDMYGGGLRLVVRNLISGCIFPVFRLFGVKIIRIGRSVGPISNFMAFSEWVRCIFLSHYYVRDSLSLKRCKKYGMKKVKTCPDMSWIYDSNHDRKINKTNIVMVNLRNSIFDEVDDEFVEATVKKCEDIISELNKSMDGKMKICVAYQISEDADFSKTVYQRLKQQFDAEYVDHQMQLDEIEHCYGKVDYHISNRMHSLLAGYKYGSLPIALIDTKKHVKIAATFQDCNIENLMVDIYDQTDRISEIIENRELLMNKLFECEEVQQHAIVEVLDFIFNKQGNDKR